MLLASEDIKEKQNEPPRPLSSTVPAVAGRQLVRAAAYASDSGEGLHCFLVVQIKVMLQQPLTCDSLFMLPACEGESVSSYFSMACCSVVSY